MLQLIQGEDSLNPREKSMGEAVSYRLWALGSVPPFYASFDGLAGWYKP